MQSMYDYRQDNERNWKSLSVITKFMENVGRIDKEYRITFISVLLIFWTDIMATPGNSWAVKLTRYFLASIGFWTANTTRGKKIMYWLVYYGFAALIGSELVLIVDIFHIYNLGDLDVSYFSSMNLKNK